MATFYAPAKINLTLEVLARQVDGFHGVRSVMVPLGLADELIVEPNDRFAFACDRPELAGNDNLAVRALRALGALPPCRLTLRKQIPVQAGLGGGSSDAAAVLRAAMTGAFGTFAADWLQVARALGSDVPFFLAETGALVEGTGERVTPLGALPRWHVVVVKPPAGVATAAAYARLDQRERAIRPRRDSVSIAAATALQRGDFATVQSLLHNDFQTTVLEMVPEVATALDALRAAGAVTPLLAGSGSSVFALAPDAAAAQSLADGVHLPAEYAIYRTAFAPAPAWRA